MKPLTLTAVTAVTAVTTKMTPGNLTDLTQMNSTRGECPLELREKITLVQYAPKHALDLGT